VQAGRHVEQDAVTQRYRRAMQALRESSGS